MKLPACCSNIYQHSRFLKNYRTLLVLVFLGRRRSIDRRRRPCVRERASKSPPACCSQIFTIQQAKHHFRRAFYYEGDLEGRFADGI